MDIFYKIDKLSLQEKKNLMIECKKVCFDYWIDKLDCNVSFARQKADLTFDEIMEKCNESSFFVFIDRKFHSLYEKKHFEVGFSTSEKIDHFLFMWIEDEKAQEIIKKWELEVM